MAMLPVNTEENPISSATTPIHCVGVDLTTNKTINVYAEKILVCTITTPDSGPLNLKKGFYINTTAYIIEAITNRLVAVTDTESGYTQAYDAAKDKAAFRTFFNTISKTHVLKVVGNIRTNFIPKKLPILKNFDSFCSHCNNNFLICC